ncbi:MAG: hypothetical protein U0R44_03895 [Candidatus Micrarchaeia archaeon]
MINSLKKVTNAFSKGPFLFVWASLMYVFMLLVFLFACIGLILAYFIFLSVFNQKLDTTSLPTMAIFGVVGLLFVFLSGGLNASLARAYHSAFWREKTSLTGFYSYALDKAPEVFGIQLIRELIWLLLAGPVIAIFVFFLKGYAYLDLLVYAYVLGVTFVIHMAFTPAFLSAGAFGTGMFSSLKHTLDFFKKKHIHIVALYAIFALVWLLNFIPFIQLATIFAAYPVVYAAMIVMMEDSIKLERLDD